MTSTYLFLVVGPSESGKDDLAKALKVMSPENVSIIQKETTHSVPLHEKSLLSTQKKISQKKDILVYEGFGHQYAINIREIWTGWRKRRIQILIISNFEIIKSLKKIFGPLVVGIFVHSNSCRERILHKYKSPEYLTGELDGRLHHHDRLYEMYSGNTSFFDHVILNIGEQEDMIDQMCRLIKHYISRD